MSDDYSTENRTNTADIRSKNVVITGELRMWIGQNQNVPGTGYDLPRIADRIDKAHEDTLEAEYERGRQDGISEFCDGYIKLPKDSNGAYIRIGDKVRRVDVYKPAGTIYTVDCLKVYADGYRLVSCCGYELKPSDVTLVKYETIEQIYKDADLLIADYALNFCEPWGARSLGEMEAWKTRHLLDRLKAVLGGES